MLRFVRSHSFVGSQAHGYVPRNREAWNTGLEECDASRANLPRYIGHDIKFGLDVAVQHYADIIDVVNRCLGKTKPSTHRNPAQTR